MTSGSALVVPRAHGWTLPAEATCKSTEVLNLRILNKLGFNAAFLGACAGQWKCAVMKEL